MKCPFCGGFDSKVVDSRPTEEGHAIRRRRGCDRCSKRFTTYEKVTANLENTLEFKVSRHLTTKLFLHARFDDGVTLTEKNRTYFQFKEMLTFGLAYTW